MKRIRIDNFIKDFIVNSVIKISAVEIKIEDKFYKIDNSIGNFGYPIYHFTKNNIFSIELKMINERNDELITVNKKINIENLVDQRNELLLLVTSDNNLLENTLTYKKWFSKFILTMIITIASMFLIVAMYSKGIYSFSTLTILLSGWLIWTITIQIAKIIIYDYHKIYSKISQNTDRNFVGINLIADVRKEEYVES